MSILKWLSELFPSDKSERERGYKFCMAELEQGTTVETLEISSDDPFDYTPFNSGMKDALRDWATSESSIPKDGEGEK